MSVVAESKRRLEVGSLAALALGVAVTAGVAVYNLRGKLSAWVANSQSLERLDALMRNYGDIAIFALISAGVVWAILYFGWTRRKAPGRGFTDLAILLVASVVLQAAVMHVAVARADAAPVSADVVQAELARSLAAAETLQAHDAPLGLAGAQGDRAVVRGVLNTMATAMRNDRRQYVYEMKGYNFTWHISPMALASIPGGERARDRLFKARYSVNIQRTRLAERIAQARASLAAAELKDKPTALAGFDRAAGVMKADVEKSLATQEALLGEYDALVKVTANRSRFSFGDGKLAFVSPADQAAYASHREKAQALESRLDPETGRLKTQAVPAAG